MASRKKNSYGDDEPLCTQPGPSRTKDTGKRKKKNVVADDNNSSGVRQNVTTDDTNQVAQDNNRDDTNEDGNSVPNPPMMEPITLVQNEPRRTYLITYSQVDKRTFPSRESFAKACEEACGGDKHDEEDFQMNQRWNTFRFGHKFVGAGRVEDIPACGKCFSKLVLSQW